MNENLDLTKILKGCPRGTKFYSTIYDAVYFYRIVNNTPYTIEFIVYSKKEDLSAVASVTKDGLDDHNFNGECTLFPSKDQRDWSKFVRFWDKPKIEKFNPIRLCNLLMKF